MPDERPISDAKPGPAYPIASVDNALRLLLMFRDHGQLRLSEVATSLGVAHSTAHRLLAMLVHHDFVRQDGDLRTYVVGPALLDVGLAAVRRIDIRTYAQPVLDDLSAATEETVHLGQLEGTSVRYLAAAESDQPLRVAARTGQLLPARSTANGKALLAELSRVQVDELFPVSTEAGTPEALTAEEREELHLELERVREMGYATNYRRGVDIVSVAVVVRDRQGVAIAAINASAPATRMTKKRRLEVLYMLRAAARRLEEILRAVDHT
jgi:DNA-binding IclR family transcriptional regulator